jgi:hypothetical protein
MDGKLGEPMQREPALIARDLRRGCHAPGAIRARFGQEPPA